MRAQFGRAITTKPTWDWPEATGLAEAMMTALVRPS
jgi:hypothetical protein